MVGKTVYFARRGGQGRLRNLRCIAQTVKRDVTWRFLTRITAAVERVVGADLDFGERFGAEVHGPRISRVRRISRHPRVTLAAICSEC